MRPRRSGDHMPTQTESQAKGASSVTCLRFYTALLLLACSSLLPARAQEDLCAEIVESALASVPQICATLGRDQLCVSHPQVEASYAEGVQEPVSAADLAKVQSSGLDMDAGHFGVALLHLGASLPQTYTGPGVLVLLAGAAEIINEIDPAAAIEISEPLNTAALRETTLFRHPGLIPEALATVAADDLLLVDAIDDAGDWLRVVNEGMIAWVERDHVARLKAMDGLPKLDLGAAFPFRALSIATSSEYPACAQAAPMVAIQTPAERPLSLTVNGVDIHIGSLVSFQQAHGSALSLTVHRGKATTVSGTIVRQGESVIGILRRERDWRALDWSGALPASEAEIARGQRAQDALNRLARVNGWGEYKTFKHPPATMHAVERGDSLYSIARLYDASVADIILANLRDEPIKLYVGTKLVIPNPGSGFAGAGDVPLDATRGD